MSLYVVNSRFSLCLPLARLVPLIFIRVIFKLYHLHFNNMILFGLVRARILEADIIFNVNAHHISLNIQYLMKFLSYFPHCRFVAFHCDRSIFQGVVICIFFLCYFYRYLNKILKLGLKKVFGKVSFPRSTAAWLFFLYCILILHYSVNVINRYFSDSIEMDNLTTNLPKFNHKFHLKAFQSHVFSYHKQGIYR